MVLGTHVHPFAVPLLLVKLAGNYHLMINSLSILGAKWKVLKFAKEDASILESFTDGLLFLTTSEEFEIIPWYTYDIDLIATMLYNYHSDYIDCSILASAYVNSDIFITEEKSTMKELAEKIPSSYEIYRRVLKLFHETVSDYGFFVSF